MKYLVQAIFITLSFFTINVKAQSNDNTLVASDSEFVMKVVREKGEIVLTVEFSDSAMFDYMAIERKVFSDPSYSQCKYVDYKDVKAANMKIKRKDTYPYPASSDVLYRLKITTKDGIIRIFPPIRLAAVELKKVEPALKK